MNKGEYMNFFYCVH